jgi:hypothetical protein
MVVAAGAEPDRYVEPIVATIAVIGVALLLAWLSFRRQEL